MNDFVFLILMRISIEMQLEFQLNLQNRVTFISLYKMMEFLEPNGVRQKI